MEKQRRHKGPKRGQKQHKTEKGTMMIKGTENNEEEFVLLDQSQGEE